MLERDRSKGGYIEPADPYNEEACLGHIRRLLEADEVLFGPHALDAMEQEVPRYTFEDVYEGLLTGRMLENYPEAVRGPCCLINGKTKQGRPVHVVCTTARTPLFIITVYEPKPPKFVTPSQRGSG